ncbi:MAG: hypothetical protein DLM53_02795 [Candidatus Eremiobacter antarcticus]|nr:LptF/LptG family permease [Candidatus Eremiobacteraeota bacterium]MBC5808339.1 LptF/LptG family permease [Candidatus Eremiobacteraeota bacterium]PZR63707.1 MAG: hypothetical protein DLM53_02795 [Candidatus Eremiobacter sp. RRmetagenome_bin22]
MSTSSEASAPHGESYGVLSESPRLAPAAGSSLDWLTSEGPRSLPSAPIKPRRSIFSILDAYLTREIAAPFGFAVAAFTLFLLINTFFLAADYIINKSVPFGLVMRYIVLQVPSFVYLILPFSALFGVLQGFGRLAGDNEMTAMRTSGITLTRIAMPAFAMGIALAIVAFLINEFVAPQSQHKSQAIFRQIAYHSSQPIIAPDQFIRTDDGKHSIYVGSTDPQTKLMHNVQIYSLGTGFFPETLTAATARQAQGKLILADGVQTIYGPSGLVTKQQRFHTLEFPLANASVLFEGARGPFEMNSRQLSAQIKALKGSGDDVRQYQISLQQKYAMPLACLISIFIALPLGVRFGKRGRGVGAMLAVVVLFVYYLIMSATYALGKDGALPANLAPWIPNMILGLAGLVMIWREER